MLFFKWWVLRTRTFVKILSFSSNLVDVVEIAGVVVDVEDVFDVEVKVDVSVEADVDVVANSDVGINVEVFVREAVEFVKEFLSVAFFLVLISHH